MKTIYFTIAKNLIALRKEGGTDAFLKLAKKDPASALAQIGGTTYARKVTSRKTYKAERLSAALMRAVRLHAAAIPSKSEAHWDGIDIRIATAIAGALIEGEERTNKIPTPDCVRATTAMYTAQNNYEAALLALGRCLSSLPQTAPGPFGPSGGFDIYGSAEASDPVPNCNAFAGDLNVAANRLNLAIRDAAHFCN